MCVWKEQVCDAIREREMGQADKSWTETIMGDTQSIRKWVERDFILFYFFEVLKAATTQDVNGEKKAFS